MKYRASRAYHLWRLCHTVRLFCADLREALDDAWDWGRGYLFAPRVERPVPFMPYSNSTKRERLEVHIANGTSRRQVEAYLKSLQPRPRPAMGLGLPPGPRTTDRRVW